MPSTTTAGAATAPIAGGRTIVATGGNPWGAEIADVTGRRQGQPDRDELGRPGEVAWALSIYPQAVNGTSRSTRPSIT